MSAQCIHSSISNITIDTIYIYLPNNSKITVNKGKVCPRNSVTKTTNTYSTLACYFGEHSVCSVEVEVALEPDYTYLLKDNLTPGFLIHFPNNTNC